jgi:hypothetical protein
MKTFVPVIKTVRKSSFLFACLVSTTAIFSQVVPELIFSNPVLDSGVDGQDGAKYRFSNVASGIDAVVQIRGRSSASVVLSNIDTTGGLGYDKAFQPVIGIPGVAPANSTWSMDFTLTFYKTGTSTKQTISEFHVTGLDIDGDGVTLFEWASMKKVSTLDSALVNSLTFTKTGTSPTGDDWLVQGIIANSPGIDTTAINVMAYYKYLNKDHIDFTIGATTASQTTTAGMRLNSLWFKDFYTPPLPLQLISFTTSIHAAKADLNWVTASESNLNYFSVERSLDGINFSQVGIVFAAGNTNSDTRYNFSDMLTAIHGGVAYYRLKMVDADGKNSYSASRMIKIEGQQDNDLLLSTYPNPVINNVNVTIPASWQGQKVMYEIFSAIGIRSLHYQTAESSQTESLNLTNLAPGLYIVKTSCNGQAIFQKIVKQ